MSGKSLGSLSYMPLLKLAMLLDQPNPVYHSWRVLLTHAEEVAGELMRLTVRVIVSTLFLLLLLLC